LAAGYWRCFRHQQHVSSPGGRLAGPAPLLVGNNDGMNLGGCKWRACRAGSPFASKRMEGTVRLLESKQGLHEIAAPGRPDCRAGVYLLI